MTVAAPLLYPPQRPAQPSVVPAQWLDVSNHQGNLPPGFFEVWGARGYGGLVVQGVQGHDGQSYTRQQLHAAQTAGWRIAGYVWLNARQDLGRIETRLRYFGHFALDFLALDVEEMGTTRGDIDLGLAVCDEYQGAPAWVYTAKWVFDGLGLSDNKYWADRNLWTAKYDGIPDVDAGFEPYGGWARCMMKQYTDVPLDQNVRRV